MIRSADDLEIPNTGASCRIVKFVRQYAVTSKMRYSDAVLKRQAPRATAVQIDGLLVPNHSHRLAKATRARSAEGGCPRRRRRRDHTSHTMIVPPREEAERVPSAQEAAPNGAVPTDASSPECCRGRR